MTALPAIDPVVEMTIRAATAALLASAAFAKWRDRGVFRSAVAGYQLLPAALVPAATVGLLTAEFAIAIGMLFWGGALFSASAVALLSLYTAAIVWNLARGRRSIDCGCGGSQRSRPLSGGLVARNLLLIAAIAPAALPVAARSWLWIDTWTCLAATLALALLYSAAELSARLHPHPMSTAS